MISKNMIINIEEEETVIYDKNYIF